MILLHHLLEHTAEKFPDKVAVIQSDDRQTYSTLEKNANCIANALLKADIQIDYDN